MNEVFLRKYGPWALVTGASSGIGATFGRRLAELGFNLVLVARRRPRLQKIADELSASYGVQVRIVAADLSTADFLDALVEATREISIGLLVNNAGFAVTGRLIEHDLEAELSLLHTNCRAPLILSHYYGRQMSGRGKGGIINVSSASALMPIPFWANYSSSKVYLLHLSEALWFELGKQGVDVLAVCPGSTDTEFGKIAGTNLRGMPAAKVVDCALKNLGKKPSVMVGFVYALSDFMLRFISRKSAVRLASKAVGD